ncbi:uncharacterized protein LOC106076489 [Biomphalaria glabrata]|uniref:Uncharacterized protein LOC106076489 n=1 Tax=Biomphalaria glabrata TaxID=6526 RepID=A0A9W3ABK4_BIOGL|nr:uncharacterized protein LOC106076489 [Biomphalaria glabrata]
MSTTPDSRSLIFLNQHVEMLVLLGILLFPTLVSYLRRLIHKTVEENFPELITFSIGSGDFRCTVVSFKVACERGPRGLELMSASIPHVPRGRGRGRELTSAERVAQWVNQREERRLTKERWAGSTVQGQLVETLKSSVESDSSSERSKARRQGAQLYVPPSLRDKKLNATIVSLASGLVSKTGSDDNLMTNELQETSASVVETPSVASFEQEVDRTRSKGRGRGKKKPEVEIYVPRAMRAFKNDTKQEELAVSQTNGYFSVNHIDNDQNITQPDIKDIKGTYVDSKEIDRMAEIDLIQNDQLINKINITVADQHLDEVDTTDSDRPVESILETDLCLVQCVLDRDSMNGLHTSEGELNKPIQLSSCLNVGTSHQDCANCLVSQSADIKSLEYENVDKLYLDTSESSSFDHSSVEVKHEKCNADETNVATNVAPDFTERTSNAFTFEFYDPAVIAFLPSPPIQTQHVDFPRPQEHTSVCQSNSSSNSQWKPLSDTLVSCDNVCESNMHHSLDISEQNDYSPLMASNYDYSNDVIPSAVASTNDDSIPCKIPVNPVLSEKLPSKKHKNKKKTKDSKESKSKKGKVEGSKKVKKPSGEINGVNKLEREQKKTSISKDEKYEENEGVEDSWDTLFDDNGDCLDESTMKELTEYVGQVEIDKPKINYLKYEPKELPLDTEAFSHIIEIYDFPPELATCDLIAAFREFASRGFDVKWVDDTHALGVFSSAVAANEALKMFHPLLKVRSMSEASKKGQQKARHCQEFLQPYKARPETTSIAARRLVAGALGMAPRVSREVRDQEKQKLKEAKEKRRQERQQKSDMWDGSFGKCAMDDEDQSVR